MTVIAGTTQILRRLATGAAGSPTLKPGQQFMNEGDGGGGVLYIGVGNNAGAATGNVAIGGRGAFHPKGRTPIADAAYTILAIDVRVVLTSITAARTWALPAASAFDPKADLTIFDESGALSSALALTIAASGSDTIVGQPSIDLIQPYQKILLHSNGSNLWTYR